MPTALRTLRLVTLVLWVGGIAFFAFVTAPVAFTYLPNPQEAGIVVRHSIAILHWIGLACGLIFLLAALLLRPIRKAQAILIAVMLTITAISQFAIIPRMERDRLQAAGAAGEGGAIETLSPADPNRIDFERLHPLSEKLEGAVLFLGLAVIVLVAREPAYSLTRNV